jgi:hypothetical protein
LLNTCFRIKANSINIIYDKQRKREDEKRMVSKKQMFAAVALIAIAMTTIAYAQIIMGTIAINTEGVVSSVPDFTLYIPKGGAVEKDIGNIELTFSENLRVGAPTYRVRVELAVDNYEIYEGLRALVVKVMQGSTVKAILTLNSPYDEFTLYVPAGVGAYPFSLPVDVIAAAGAKEVSGTIRLRVTILGVE